MLGELRQGVGGQDDRARLLGVDARDRAEHVVALEEVPEDRVRAVQPRCGVEGDEELRAVRAGPGVGHRQEASLVEGEVRDYLVVEPVAGPARAGPRRVAGLGHEALDDPMERDAVVEAVEGEEHEVVHRRGRPVLVEVEDQIALARAQDGDVVQALFQDVGGRVEDAARLVRQRLHALEPFRQRVRGGRRGRLLPLGLALRFLVRLLHGQLAAVDRPRRGLGRPVPRQPEAADDDQRDREEQRDHPHAGTPFSRRRGPGAGAAAGASMVSDMSADSTRAHPEET